MNVLVVNDDGIQAPGIQALVQALSKKATVYVCAPDQQQSGASQSITLKGGIFVHEATMDGAERALTTSGTPADCTKVGLQFFGEQGVTFDAVYSGINMGSNMGVDTLYSGTVGGAMEAALSGVQAIAVSVDSHEATEFSVACQVAVDILGFAVEKLTPATILNINAPHIPREEVKGIRYTRLGGRFYEDHFKPDGSGKYVLSGDPSPQSPEGPEYDMNSNDEGYVTITPLQYDYTQFSMIEAISKCGVEVL